MSFAICYSEYKTTTSACHNVGFVAEYGQLERWTERLLLNVTGIISRSKVTLKKHYFITYY